MEGQNLFHNGTRKGHIENREKQPRDRQPGEELKGQHRELEPAAWEPGRIARQGTERPQRMGEGPAMERSQGEENRRGTKEGMNLFKPNYELKKKQLHTNELTLVEDRENRPKILLKLF
ncbi:hypothetical protein MA16_Dca005877 [Dendrobium catenatum]|uniref:Uncharacterized protein n=1 Tax=Dendrobium catenatum TaxID=906689 RepID=A0A2I0WXG1_9ASPA|nr:hypothetical protein MA16_Dca005877 [Dendrobium catenatum]